MCLIRGRLRRWPARLGFNCLNGRFEIGFARINDSQATTTMTKGFVAAAGTGGRVRGGEVRPTGGGTLTFPIDIRTQGVVLEMFRFGSDELSGTVTLAAAGTTTLTNNNLRSPGLLGGFYLQSMVRLTPHNAAAQTLGQPRLTYGNGSAVIQHAGDVSGTAIYRWVIEKHTLTTVQAA
jgi:hypothetical protein